ncbi:MAG TPA: hypothetical protein VFQ43_21520, partial [Nitrososphaera sp.]|nr:hypothetical protein [Nitrososphaera sp.]
FGNERSTVIFDSLESFLNGVVLHPLPSFPIFLQLLISRLTGQLEIAFGSTILIVFCSTNP